ncbi:MAG: SIMPL domain-containing protein [Oscillospiraceae bacterium]|jgi:uncharacterized protein YggE|nr:SIMPL domain-containing protein [Oscillospiraceae bacterium]
MNRNFNATDRRIGFDGMILIMALALLAILFIPSVCRAEDSNLTVYGTSIATVVPDYAMIVTGYAADNPDVRVAQDETAQNMGAILSAIKALGIEDKDVVTTNLSVETIYNYREELPKISGYRVTNNVTIIVRDITQIADVVNAVFEAGANQSYGLTFRSSKEGEVYRQALADAIRIAKEKAEIMVGAAGRTLGDIVDISEIQNSYVSTPMYANSRVMMDQAAEAKGLGDTIMSGMLEISANVELHFEIGELKD